MARSPRAARTLLASTGLPGLLPQRLGGCDVGRLPCEKRGKFPRVGVRGGTACKAFGCEFCAQPVNSWSCNSPKEHPGNAAEPRLRKPHGCAGGEKAC